MGLLKKPFSGVYDGCKPKRSCCVLGSLALQLVPASRPVPHSLLLLVNPFLDSRGLVLFCVTRHCTSTCVFVYVIIHVTHGNHGQFRRPLPSSLFFVALDSSEKDAPPHTKMCTIRLQLLSDLLFCFFKEKNFLLCF